MASWQYTTCTINYLDSNKPKSFSVLHLLPWGDIISIEDFKPVFLLSNKAWLILSGHRKMQWHYAINFWIWAHILVSTSVIPTDERTEQAIGLQLSFKANIKPRKFRITHFVLMRKFRTKLLHTEVNRLTYFKEIDRYLITDTCTLYWFLGNIRQLTLMSPALRRREFSVLNLINFDSVTYHLY